ncbi:MAG TPA: APC family permease [Terriglobales bacterium]|nr:APC family permease [Terriglobales bacterium]
MTYSAASFSPESNLPPRQRNSLRRLSFWPLVIATFFMVSGGAYGTEDIVRGAGYLRGIVILLLTPLLWSVPTALMMGELSSAIPAEGGYYAWVRRAMGDFWGFQEAWLSLGASIFDMAIYPTLFVAYLTRMVPALSLRHRGVMLGVALVALCALLNIAGIRVVATTSVGMFLLLSAPFALIVLLAPFKHGALASGALVHSAPGGVPVGMVGGLLVAMWNYMGWDNASTIAAEVDEPQRTYPRAILTAVVIVALSYILPVAAMSLTGISPNAWETGSWADLAGLVGGPGLRLAVVLGGMISAFGMFNCLVLSYSRLPLAMAQDGLLPSIFARVHPRTQAPWVAILVCATTWALCLGLGFERLVTIDILVYGSSLLLEFIALVVLRITQPDLPRPFRVPGGILGVVALGVAPTVLLGFSVIRSEHEQILGMSSFSVGLLLMAAGVAAYGIRAAWRQLRPTEGATPDAQG